MGSSSILVPVWRGFPEGHRFAAELCSASAKRLPQSGTRQRARSRAPDQVNTLGRFVRGRFHVCLRSMNPEPDRAVRSRRVLQNWRTKNPSPLREWRARTCVTTSRSGAPRPAARFSRNRAAVRHHAHRLPDGDGHRECHPVEGNGCCDARIHFLHSAEHGKWDVDAEILESYAELRLHMLPRDCRPGKRGQGKAARGQADELRQGTTDRLLVRR